MDSSKIAEAFETLKSLLGSGRNTGQQWASGGRPKESKSVALANDGWENVSDEESIVAVAEETRLYALGLHEQPRLTRKHQFSVSAHPVTEPHRFGQLVCDGRQYYVDLILKSSSYQWLIGQRALLKSGGEHTGRRVKVGYKVGDGVNYQICHEDRRTYAIVRHTVTMIELDQAPEPYETGYLVLEFL